MCHPGVGETGVGQRLVRVQRKRLFDEAEAAVEVAARKRIRPTEMVGAKESWYRCDNFFAKRIGLGEPALDV